MFVPSRLPPSYVGHYDGSAVLHLLRPHVAGDEARAKARNAVMTEAELSRRTGPSESLGSGGSTEINSQEGSEKEEESLGHGKAQDDPLPNDGGARCAAMHHVPGLDERSPIVYHYLTFETELPWPSERSVIGGDAATAPPRPDLSPYISPFLWSNQRKRFTVYLCCVATAITAYTAGSYSPPVPQMSAEWHVSEVAILVGITTFCTGFAIAPMVLAPFSEINGRYPVFVGAGIVYVVCQLCCAVTRSYPGMIVARFFTGVGSSVFSTMVGGVISDLYHAENRNTPMALFSGGALLGTGLGPLVSGFISQYSSWRWVFYVQVIMDFVLVVAIALFLRETRGSILLSRKGEKLNKWYGERENAGFWGVDMPLAEGSEKKQSQRIRWKVKSDEERESISKMIGVSVYRPFRMSPPATVSRIQLTRDVDLLVTEPVVFFFSLWVAFAWAVLYLTFGAITLVFETSHHFTISQAGSVFASMSIGAIIATILAIFQDKMLARFHKPNPEPEGRLYFACIESALLPVGLFWFGWTQFSHIPWIVPTLAVGCATMGIYSIYLATFNYLADTYHRYASSALAAQSFCK